MNIESGKISGGSRGCGILVNNGYVVMNGGEVTGNFGKEALLSKGNTGIVTDYYGSVKIYNGEISGGKGKQKGGTGIEMDYPGTVEVYGGNITGGVGYIGGNGISVNDGEVVIFNGKNKGGRGDDDWLGGGGNGVKVQRYGRVNMRGGTVIGGDSRYRGGNGVYISCYDDFSHCGYSFFMEGGVIHAGISYNYDMPGCGIKIIDGAIDIIAGSIYRADSCGNSRNGSFAVSGRSVDEIVDMESFITDKSVFQNKKYIIVDVAINKSGNEIKRYPEFKQVSQETGIILEAIEASFPFEAFLNAREVELSEANYGVIFCFYNVFSDATLEEDVELTNENIEIDVNTIRDSLDEESYVYWQEDETNALDDIELIKYYKISVLDEHGFSLQPENDNAVTISIPFPEDF